MSNLDERIRRELRHELRALQQRLGITAVYVTHDREEALTLADRIAVIDGGRIAQIGTPEEIFHRPASPFVAGFMGADNASSSTPRPTTAWSAVRQPPGIGAPAGRHGGAHVAAAGRGRFAPISAATWRASRRPDAPAGRAAPRRARRSRRYLGAGLSLSRAHRRRQYLVDARARIARRRGRRPSSSRRPALHLFPGSAPQARAHRAH